jgi:hypothetical protein
MVGSVGSCWTLPLRGADDILAKEMHFLRSSTGRFGSSLDGGVTFVSICFFSGGCRAPWCSDVGNLHGGGCGAHYGPMMEAIFRSWG